MILKIKWNYPCLKEDAETAVWEYISAEKIKTTRRPNGDIDIDYVLNEEYKELSLLASSEAYIMENGKTIEKIK